jgi:hypothetical protein
MSIELDRWVLAGFASRAAHAESQVFHAHVSPGQDEQIEPEIKDRKALASVPDETVIDGEVVGAADEP